MQKTLRLAVVFPVLFAVSQFLWKKLPVSYLPEPIHTVLTDTTGPAFLMAAVIFTSCSLLWRIPCLRVLINYLFGTNIYIQGTWKGTLHYTFESAKSKPAYLVIKQQDAFSVDVWFLTDERTSTNTIAIAKIIPHNGISRLVYEYGVEDSVENKNRNPLHKGFCVIDINMNGRETMLSGYYYTSRKTVGKMEFVQRNRRTVTNYKQAEALF